MKRISPIEVVAQTGLNRLEENVYRAPRAVVEQKLAEMYPNSSLEHIKSIVDRAIRKTLVRQEGDDLVVL